MSCTTWVELGCYFSMNQWLIQINARTCFKLEIPSFNSRPFVSNGKNSTDTPERKTTISNRTTAAVWWHPCIIPTATRGHTIPPTLPTELAMPTPVVLTDVGYICSTEKKHTDINLMGFKRKWFNNEHAV